MNDRIYEMGSSETTDYQALADQADAAIRAGRADLAARALKTLNSAKIARPWRLPLARLCRRSGLWALGLSLLAEVVHSGKPSVAAATAAEKAEYGMLLFRMGATNEAALVLSQVDAVEAPEVHHFSALIHMQRWEFAQAIGEFDLYLQKQPAPYAALVARTNLALAQIERGGKSEARELLDENIRVCKDQRHVRMLCTNLAYRAQLHVLCDDRAAARADIREGEPILESADTSDRLLFVKWKLILDALDADNLKPLQKLRSLALAANSWEDVRLADLYSLRVHFHMSRFLYLIFGTPFAGFRRRICREMGAMPDRDHFYLGPKKARRFDLTTGELDGAATAIRGEKPHQLFEVLLRDFYHPLRIAGLFSELFPGDCFDPKSSPNRTHAVINRTRAWLRENSIPVEIRESGGFYRLDMHGDFSFRIPLERRPVVALELELNQLAAAFAKPGTFTAAEARSELEVSRQTVQRIVDWALENNRLERVGDGRTTYYRLRPRSKAA